MQRTPHFLSSIYEISAKGPRDPAMEGIRGIAVFLVFFVHFYQQYAQHLPLQSFASKFFLWAGTVGHAGVDLFFLLSGYLIYRVVRSGKQSIPEFLHRRMWRIYPTYLVVFIVYCLCMLLQPQFSKFPDQHRNAAIYLLENILLLPGIFKIAPLITVAWSLSYEIFYYAALPLLYWTCRMGRWTAGARCAFFGCLTLTFCFFCAKSDLSFPAIALYPTRHVRLIMFAAGILVYEVFSLKERPQWLSSRLEWATILAIFISLATVPAIHGFQYVDVIQAAIWFVTFSGLVLCCLAYPDGMLGRAFSWTPLRWLGNMSYSYYLCHAFILHLVFRIASRATWYWSPSGTWMLAAIGFACTWIGATLLFVCVEKPLSFTIQTQPRQRLVLVGKVGESGLG